MNRKWWFRINKCSFLSPFIRIRFVFCRKWWLVKLLAKQHTNMESFLMIPLNQQKRKKLLFFVIHSSSERFNSRTLKMLQWQNRPYYHYYYWNVIQLVHNLWDDVRLALKMGKHYNGEFIGMRWKRVSLIQIK